MGDSSNFVSDFFLDTEPMSDHEKASIKPLTDQKEARVSRQMLCNHELEVFSEKAVAIFTETSCPAVWVHYETDTTTALRIARRF